MRKRPLPIEKSCMCDVGQDALSDEICGKKALYLVDGERRCGQHTPKVKKILT